jgi:hypothetical protein
LSRYGLFADKNGGNARKRGRGLVSSEYMTVMEGMQGANGGISVYKSIEDDAGVLNFVAI